MRWLPLPLLLLVALVATATPAAASSCVNLQVSAKTKRALKHAHHRSADGSLSPGSTYYGRCGKTHYAITSFSKAVADQPEKFRKRSGHGWKDKGDGFENGCDAGARNPIPAALVKLWGVCPSL